MEKTKGYFSGEWYKKKSFLIAVAVLVLAVIGVCVWAFAGIGGKNEDSQKPAITMTYEEVKDHYGIYSESYTGAMYSCKDINGNKLTGSRAVIRAEMKKGMTKEELYNDALVIDKELGMVETEIHFIYKLDSTYNVTITLCKGELFTVTPAGRQFLTKEQWLASFENKEA